MRSARLRVVIVVLGTLVTALGGAGCSSTTGGTGSGQAGSSGGRGSQSGGGGSMTPGGISIDCQSCAGSTCPAAVFTACQASSACLTCVATDFGACIASQNSEYLAICQCAVEACPSCAAYCPGSGGPGGAAGTGGTTGSAGSTGADGGDSSALGWGCTETASGCGCTNNTPPGVTQTTCTMTYSCCVINSLPSGPSACSCVNPKSGLTCDQLAMASGGSITSKCPP